jgi:serine/threonine protein kinase
MNDLEPRQASPPSRRIEDQIRSALHGTYRVEREIGAGGFGTVYLAEDLRHGRKVAIKLLRPEVAASAGAERFLREIRIVASLQHPNILGLIDSGVTDGLLYYVMPYVEGSTLRVRLAREGGLGIDEAVRLLREVAEALAHAHERGVVHRDVKPENVLFMAGHALLADFGVAKALVDRAAAAEATEIGMAVGSPAYMAPEAAAGESVDRRTDVYAFGVLAYEVLGGQHPFFGTSPVQMMLAHLTREVPPLRGLRPDLPAELDALVMRCLAKDPGDRWQSAGEIARRLELVPLSGATAAARWGAHDVTVGRFRLTESVCRKLRRESFSPKMIGDEIEYLDNGARSNVLVFFVHAIGLDGADFEAHLRSLPFRGIAPTLYGFEPSRRRRFTLPLDDHLVLLRELLDEVVRRSSPSTVLVVGFSSGGDVALRLAVERPEGAVPVDGVLTLGCNLSFETCFLTGILARLENGKGAAALHDLRALGATIADLDEWISIHSYLVRMLRKFRIDVAPLRDFARDVVRPFAEPAEITESQFVRWYREAGRRGAALTCLFEDTEVCNRLVGEVQLQNLEAGTLGPRYREGSLLIVPETSHFDLLEPDLVRQHLEELAQLAGAGNDTTTPLR